MSSRLPPLRVPTLTEVIEPEAPPPVPVLPAADELTARVLADVLRQVELMLEHRVREALMPSLQQAADGLVLQARTELATALNDVVARAVEQELARLRLP